MKIKQEINIIKFYQAFLRDNADYLRVNNVLIKQKDEKL